MDTINITRLTAALQATPPEVYVEVSDVNPYLLNYLLPMLRAGHSPRLSELDFDAFEADDLPRLYGYVEEMNRAEYTLTQINKTFCAAEPARAEIRTFF